MAAGLLTTFQQNAKEPRRFQNTEAQGLVIVFRPHLPLERPGLITPYRPSQRHPGGFGFYAIGFLGA